MKSSNGLKEITDIKEIQDYLLNILLKFDKVCRNNDLRYSLMGGSMIGAVRHNGFIPWDDDIDVSMPRPDYERFLEIAQEHLNKNFEIKSIYNDSSYIYPYAKLIDNDFLLVETNLRPEFAKFGLYLDIFPVDGYPESEEVANDHYELINKYKKKTVLGVEKIKPYTSIPRIINNIRKNFYHTLDPIKMVNIRDELFKKYPFDMASHVALSTDYAQKSKMRKEDYLKRIDIDFCGYDISCSSNYHETLRNIYGDYMELPPEEMRVSNHNYKLYKRVKSV